MKKIDPFSFDDDENLEKNDLLMTIRVPRNLHYLTERLPGANYEDGVKGG